MAGRIEWLEGVRAADAERVGWRAVLFSRLIEAGVPVPRGFVLPAQLYHDFTTNPPGEPLPAPVASAIEDGWAELSGPAAVRASPLGAPTASKARSRGGRPQREMYLNLVDAAEVREGVRRFWTRMRESSPPTPAAAIVQRFIAADASAVIHEPPALTEALLIESCFGCGDLLAAGLVLADKTIVELPKGRIRSRRIGRKQHHSEPQPEGGVRRRTSPPAAARQPSISDETAASLVDLWRRVEDVLGPLRYLSVAVENGRPWVTSARVETD